MDEQSAFPNVGEQLESQVARDTLERYSGSPVDEYRSYLLLTNFSRYVEYFAQKRGLKTYEGAMFKVAHSPEEDISFLDFKIGSPAAALVVDVCAHLPFKASLLLGMCGGLRRHYKVGDYFVPIAAIRGDGTSDFYFPPEVPALANFVVQRAVTDVLQTQDLEYHIGITYTMNKRFWEFNEEFKRKVMATRAQAIELECATLFVASYRYKLPLGALLIVSDLPLMQGGVKTKSSSQQVFENHMANHVDMGVRVLQETRQIIEKSHSKGARRGPGRRLHD
ncbi:MAG: AMP nucleosidase [Verrucomicrobia bacterium]|nr:AMP nucleosidase [Verrucomicrobiota bacterium]